MRLTLQRDIGEGNRIGARPAALAASKAVQRGTCGLWCRGSLVVVLSVIFRKGLTPALLAFAAVTWSCEKIVTVDAGSSAPQIVIQGVVADRQTQQLVLLNMTGDYGNTAASQPAVSHARVIIADNAGTVDTLVEVKSGSYRSSRIQGVPGRTYSLDVTANGRRYSATSSMPARVAIDSLFAVPTTLINGAHGYTIDIMFKDPPGKGNYYRMEFRTNEGWVNDFLAWGQFVLYSDDLDNGNEVSYRVALAENVSPGDTLSVRLISMDRAAYDYFSSLNNNVASAENPIPVSPSNPVTNLTNGSLGYFAAFAVDTRTIVLR